MSGTLRAVIVGSGFMGRVHAQAVRASGARVAAVVASTAESARVLAGLFPGARAATSLDSVIDEADVVHVCTPNASHFEYAWRALAASRPVICEKPLATTLDHAVRLVHAADEGGVVTGVPFIYRFHPLVREIRRRIAVDPDNRLWLLHGSYLQDWLADRRLTNWRVDPARGGVSRAFADIGVHWCDLMEFVTGQRIVRLSARAGNAFEREGGPRQNLTEDGAVVLFETDQGALGTLAVSQASAGRRNRLWFSFDGPTTSYSFDQEDPEHAWVGGREGSLLLHREPTRGDGDETARPFALPAGHAQGYQHCFNDFVSDSYAAIAGDELPDRPDFVDGLRAALITHAVVASIDQQAWVDVPTIDAALQRTRSNTPAPVRRSQGKAS